MTYLLGECSYKRADSVRRKLGTQRRSSACCQYPPYQGDDGAPKALVGLLGLDEEMRGGGDLVGRHGAVVVKIKSADGLAHFFRQGLDVDCAGAQGRAHQFPR